MNKLHIKAEIEKTAKGMQAIASTAVEDRHGEVVSVSGWDLKNFKKNPVMLWAHDHYEPAIGTAKNMKVEGEGKKARLVFEPVFHDKTPMAKALSAMVDEGIINSFSVGFRPIEMDGNTYTNQELLEVSLVNVPANPDARMLAMKSLEKRGFDEKTIEEVKGFIEETTDDEIVDNKATVEDVNELKAQIAEQKETIDELVKGLQHLNPHGRKNEVVTQRLALAKVSARAADKLLEGKPKGKQATYLKVIKRASEKLIVDHKQELKLNGKN